MTARETWRAVPGWEGAYEVSDLGRVRSLDRLVTAGTVAVQPGNAQVADRHTTGKTVPDSAPVPAPVPGVCRPC